MKEFEPINEQQPEYQGMGLNGTPQENADAMSAIYHSLETMEEKLEFLLKDSAYHSVIASAHNDEIPKEELDMLMQLREEFAETYIRNSDQATQKKVFQTLSRLTSEINTSTLKDYRQQLSKIPTEDLQRDNKAYYLARNNAYNNVMITIAGQLHLDLNNAYVLSPRVNAQLRQQIRITDRTTMEQLAGYMGFSGERLQQYLQQQNAPAHAPAIAFYQAKYEINRNDAVSQIYDDMKIKQAANWEYAAEEEYLNERGYSQMQKTHFREISSKNTKEFSIPNALQGWIRDEAAPQLAARDQDNRTAVVKDYDTGFIATRETRALRRTSPERIRRPSAESYGWLVNEEQLEDGTYRAVPVTKPELERLKIDTGMHAGPEVKYWTEVRSGGVFTDPVLLNKTKNVMTNTRPPTVASMFVLWALGTHDNIHASNMLELQENPELVEEFARFCEHHPTVGAKDRNSYQQSVKVWTDIYERATEKVKAYTLTPPDPRDPVKNRKTLKELARLNGLCVDFIQEMSRNLKHDTYCHDEKDMGESTMGQRKWNETLTTWKSIQQLLQPAKDGYLPGDLSANSNSAFRRVASTATARVMADQIFRKHAGKSLGRIIGEEAHNLPCIGLASADLSGLLYDESGVRNPKFNHHPHIPRKDFVKYLNGKDKGSFTKKILPLLEQNISEFRSKLDQECIAAFTVFTGRLDLRGVKDALLAVPEDDPQAVQDFLRDTSTFRWGVNGDTTKKSWLTQSMNILFGDVFRSQMTLAGIKDKMDVFLIDGKTPAELWGQKYKDVQDPGLKQQCLSFEVMKKIAAGETEVRIKTFGYGADQRLTVSGSLILSPTADMAKRLKGNLAIYKKGMAEMLQELEETRAQLISTHPGFQDTEAGRRTAIHEMGRTGTSLFRSYEQSLKNCIRVMKNTAASTPEDIRKAMLQLQEASAKYYKARKPLFGSKRTPEGQTRLDTSRQLADRMPEMLTRFQTLRRGIDTDLPCIGTRTFHTAPQADIERNIAAFSEAQYDGIYRQEEVQPSEAETAAANASCAAFARTLRRGMLRLGKDMDSLLNLPKNPEPYDAALSFYLQNTMENTLYGRYTPEEIEQKRQAFAHRVVNGDLQQRAEALSRNPIFRECIRQNGAFDYREWRTIWNSSKRYIQEMKNDLQRVSGQHLDAARYILTGDAKAGTLGSLPKDKNILEARYRRLGDHVAKQILTDPENKDSVHAICSGRMRYADVVKTVTAVLKESNILNGQTYPEEQLREQLSSGQLKQLVTKTIRQQTEAKAKLHARVLAGRRPARNQPQPRMAQH